MAEKMETAGDEAMDRPRPSDPALSVERSNPGEAEGSEFLIHNGDGNVIPCSHLPRVVGSGPAIAETLRHNTGNAATGGIWRVRGTRGSAILKIARPPAAGPESGSAAWQTSDDPAHWNYWRREVLAYESGLAATVYADAGIAAPTLLESAPRTGGEVELWLEDVGGAAGFAWEVPRIARFARELGAGQARWVGRVPETPWLSRHWLAQYSSHGPGRSVNLQDADWDHPRVSAWPAEVRLRLRRLWTDRQRALAAAESVERTLCHLDVWPANLVDSDGVSVLLDWPFTGEGGIGEDVSNLIIDSCTDGLMDAALLPEIAETAAEGYIGGLRDGGWNGSADRVRAAIAACGVAKYSWFGPAVMGRAVRDDVGKSNYGQDTSAAAALRRLGGLAELIAQWSESVLGV